MNENDSEHPLHIHGGNGRPWVIAWFDDFDGRHSFEALSNFYIGDPIYIRFLDNRPFMTGEHAFAAMKARDSAKEYEAIRKASSPGEAKMLGRQCRLRSDWEAVKYDAMMAVLRAKFTLERKEGEILLSTGDALLVEGTHWHDTVWGVSLTSADALKSPGRNWLGTLLMARRAELKAEAAFGYRHPTGEYNAIFVTDKM